MKPRLSRHVLVVAVLFLSIRASSPLPLVTFNQTTMISGSLFLSSSEILITAPLTVNGSLFINGSQLTLSSNLDVQGDFSFFESVLTYVGAATISVGACALLVNSSAAFNFQSDDTTGGSLSFTLLASADPNCSSTFASVTGVGTPSCLRVVTHPLYNGGIPTVAQVYSGNSLVYNFLYAAPIGCGRSLTMVLALVLSVLGIAVVCVAAGLSVFLRRACRPVRGSEAETELIIS